MAQRVGPSGCLAQQLKKKPLRKGASTSTTPGGFLDDAQPIDLLRHPLLRFVSIEGDIQLTVGKVDDVFFAHTFQIRRLLIHKGPGGF